MDEYHQKHGVTHLQGRQNGQCYYCYADTTHKCTTCDAFLCPMSVATGKDCHARFHDPKCKGLAEIDRGDRKQEYHSMQKLKKHATKSAT